MKKPKREPFQKQPKILSHTEIEEILLKQAREVTRRREYVPLKQILEVVQWVVLFTAVLTFAVLLLVTGGWHLASGQWSIDEIGQSLLVTCALTLAAPAGVGLLVFAAMHYHYREGRITRDEYLLGENQEGRPREITITKKGKVTSTLTYPPFDRRLIWANNGERLEFVFTGRNMDALRRWQKSGTDGGGIRKERNASGNRGFEDLPDPIVANDYTVCLDVMIKCGIVRREGGRHVWAGDVEAFLYDHSETHLHTASPVEPAV